MIAIRAQPDPSVPTPQLKLHAQLATSVQLSRVKRKATRLSQVAKLTQMLKLIALPENTALEGQV